MAKKKQAKSTKSRSGYTDRELMYTVHPAIKAGGTARPRLIEGRPVVTAAPGGKKR